jgi:iron(III) transport system permease protein
VTALVYVEILDAAGPVRSALRAAFGREVADVWFPEVRSLSACIVLFAFVLYPYVFVAARAAFLSRDPSIFAAARTLGSGPLHLFLRVALPLARPAVAVGTTLVLLETLNDIGASEYLGVRTLTVSAYTAWLNQGDLAGAAQIACIALLMVAILLVAEELQRDRRRYHGSANSTARSAPVELRGGQAAAAVLLCALPFAIGFAVPAGYLCVEVIRRELVLAAGPALLVQLRTTILLAIAATVVALAWSVAIVLAARVRPSRTTRRLAFVAGLGYAVPGTILVIGLLGPLVGLDTLLTRGWEVASGAKSDLILLGSGAALVVAYVIRFMRVAIVGLSAQLAHPTGDRPGGPHSRRGAVCARMACAAAADAPSARGCSAAGFRRLPEGAARDAAAAAVEPGDARDRYLRRGLARVVRGWGAGRARDRSGGPRADHVADPGHAAGAPGGGPRPMADQAAF